MTNPALDSRARFEAHRMSRNGGRRPQKWAECVEIFGLSMPPEKHLNDYISRADQFAWEAWQAAIASMAAGWISVDERLPEDRGTPWQVIAIAKKAYPGESCYPGQGIRRVQQDWVIRQWPQNFTHWHEMPPTPQDPPIAAPSRKEP